MKRDTLERWQVLVYVVAIAAGALAGLSSPAAGALLSHLLWPLLATLLFVTFLQMPLAGLSATVRAPRYLAALLAGNFVAVPLLVWGLSQWLPADPSLRLGFFLVLLVPCTDWFTTFTHLGRGDGRLALASTPILLLLQMALLPLWLLLFLGDQATAGMRAAPFLEAFAGIILLPLALAYGVERAAGHLPRLAAARERSAWLPIPLLGLVLFVIAASESRGVIAATAGLAQVALAFAAYLALVPLVAVAVTRLFRVSGPPARTLFFSLATRNSFVVLPLVLAWPGAGSVAASVVVLQSLVELCGMLIYVGLLSRRRAVAAASGP